MVTEPTVRPTRSRRLPKAEPLSFPQVQDLPLHDKRFNRRIDVLSPTTNDRAKRLDATTRMLTQVRHDSPVLVGLLRGLRLAGGRTPDDHVRHRVGIVSEMIVRHLKASLGANHALGRTVGGRAHGW